MRRVAKVHAHDGRTRIGVTIAIATSPRTLTVGEVERLKQQVADRIAGVLVGVIYTDFNRTNTTVEA